MPDRLSAWRTPLVILLCGCLIGLLGFGSRSTFGFFLAPMTNANGWGRDVFSLALAIQMLLWGATQPFAGALAARSGCWPSARWFTPSARFGWPTRTRRWSFIYRPVS